MQPPLDITADSSDDLRYRIDLIGIHRRSMGHTCAYADSSAAKGLTSRKEAWFSSDMTQRSIHHSHSTRPRHRARSGAIAQIRRLDHLIFNVAVAALVVVVVVLITPFTGAG
jgi:hypothetical protein